MEKSVVVLQANENEARDVAFNLDQQFNVILHTADCEKVIEIVKDKKPDFLVTSLILKQADGVDIIEKVKKLSPSTIVIVVTMVTNWENFRNCVNFDFDYCMVKPINYQILIDRMNAISKRKSLSLRDEEVTKQEFCDEDVEFKSEKEHIINEKISRIFIGMGIPPHIKGYGYLREGIKLAVASPEIINSVTKKLYPTIGDHFNTSASKVERAIRHAIEVAWNKGRIESFNSLFGVRAYSENEKPTNSEFIALIADRLLLDGIN